MFFLNVFVFLCSYIWYYKCKNLPKLYLSACLEEVQSVGYITGYVTEPSSVTKLLWLNPYLEKRKLLHFSFVSYQVCDVFKVS